MGLLAGAGSTSADGGADGERDGGVDRDVDAAGAIADADRVGGAGDANADSEHVHVATKYVHGGSGHVHAATKYVHTDGDLGADPYRYAGAGPGRGAGHGRTGGVAGLVRGRLSAGHGPGVCGAGAGGVAVAVWRIAPEIGAPADAQGDGALGVFYYARNIGRERSWAGIGGI